MARSRVKQVSEVSTNRDASMLSILQSYSDPDTKTFDTELAPASDLFLFYSDLVQQYEFEKSTNVWFITIWLLLEKLQESNFLLKAHFDFQVIEAEKAKNWQDLDLFCSATEEGQADSLTHEGHAEFNASILSARIKAFRGLESESDAELYQHLLERQQKEISIEAKKYIQIDEKEIGVPRYSRCEWLMKLRAFSSLTAEQKIQLDTRTRIGNGSKFDFVYSALCDPKDHKKALSDLTVGLHAHINDHVNSENELDILKIDAHLLYLRSEMYLQHNQYGRAIADINMAIELALDQYVLSHNASPKLPAYCRTTLVRFYFYQACMLIAMGKDEKSQAAFKQVADMVLSTPVCAENSASLRALCAGFHFAPDKRARMSCISNLLTSVRFSSLSLKDRLGVIGILNIFYSIKRKEFGFPTLTRDVTQKSEEAGIAAEAEFNKALLNLTQCISRAQSITPIQKEKFEKSSMLEELMFSDSDSKKLPPIKTFKKPVKAAPVASVSEEKKPTAVAAPAKKINQKARDDERAKQNKARKEKARAQKELENKLKAEEEAAKALEEKLKADAKAAQKEKAKQKQLEAKAEAKRINDEKIALRLKELETAEIRRKAATKRQAEKKVTAELSVTDPAPKAIAKLAREARQVAETSVKTSKAAKQPLEVKETKLSIDQKEYEVRYSAIVELALTIASEFDSLSHYLTTLESESAVKKITAPSHLVSDQLPKLIDRLTKVAKTLPPVDRQILKDIIQKLSISNLTKIEFPRGRDRYVKLDIGSILSKFKSAGIEAKIVGGLVRDLLLGKNPEKTLRNFKGGFVKEIDVDIVADLPKDPKAALALLETIFSEPGFVVKESNLEGMYTILWRSAPGAELVKLYEVMRSDYLADKKLVNPLAYDARRDFLHNNLYADADGFIHAPTMASLVAVTCKIVHAADRSPVCSTSIDERTPTENSFAEDPRRLLRGLMTLFADSECKEQADPFKLSSEFLKAIPFGIDVLLPAKKAEEDYTREQKIAIKRLNDFISTKIFAAAHPISVLNFLESYGIIKKLFPNLENIHSHALADILSKHCFLEDTYASMFVLENFDQLRAAWERIIHAPVFVRSGLTKDEVRAYTQQQHKFQFTHAIAQIAKSNPLYDNCFEHLQNYKLIQNPRLASIADRVLARMFPPRTISTAPASLGHVFVGSAAARMGHFQPSRPTVSIDESKNAYAKRTYM